jgi:tetratricopeptide (TPR) repeat protein
VAAQERAARAVAAAVRTSMPSKAAWVYYTLGRAYHIAGDFSKALEHHAQHLTIAKEVGDRAGEGGKAYGNLGNAYQSLGDFSKAIEYHTQTWRLQRRWATGRGRAGRTGTSASRTVAGGLCEGHRVPRAATWRLQRRWATGRGRAGRTGTSASRIAKAIEYHTQHLAIAKEVGDRAGEGRAYGNLGSAYESQGDFQGHQYHTQHLAIAKEVGDRAGRAGRTEPRQRVSVAGGLCEGHRVPRAAPGDCKGGGRPGGGGQGVREPRLRVSVAGGLQ